MDCLTLIKNLNDEDKKDIELAIRLKENLNRNEHTEVMRRLTSTVREAFNVSRDDSHPSAIEKIAISLESLSKRMDQYLEKL